MSLIYLPILENEVIFYNLLGKISDAMFFFNYVINKDICDLQLDRLLCSLNFCSMEYEIFISSREVHFLFLSLKEGRKSTMRSLPYTNVRKKFRKRVHAEGILLSMYWSKNEITILQIERCPKNYLYMYRSIIKTCVTWLKLYIFKLLNMNNA